MRNIILDQNFHGIGQGLFYSGKITLQSNRDPNSSFNFVYDCGSSSRNMYLNKEIAEYKKLKLQNKEIDLLIISHLHSDHVNGLKNLLSDVVVKNVVLPYLKPIERALLSISTKGPRWYFEFLSNPTDFFNKNGVKNIIYISRGKDFESTPPRTSENLLNEIEFLSKININFKKMKDDEETKKYSDANDKIIDSNVIFKKDSHPAKILRIWDFYFYVSPIEKNKLNSFSNAVRKLQNDSSVLEIIRDDRKRKELKEIYEKKTTKELNFTSMVCLHGPIYLLPYIDYRNEFNRGLWPFPFFSPYYPFYKELKFIYHEFYHDWNRILRDFKNLYRYRSYSFLTGDINSISEWKGLKKRYQKLFRHIHSLQIPHHGSKHNWNDEIPFDVGPCYYIISAGIRNRFSHPDLKVIQNISQNLSPDIIRWSHEYRSQIDKKIFLA